MYLFKSIKNPEAASSGFLIRLVVFRMAVAAMYFKPIPPFCYRYRGDNTIIIPYLSL